MEKITTNTLVIGGGPGGYSCAIRLGQLKVPSVIVEKNKLGGTCLNVGCIPSKALINVSTKYYQSMNDWDKLGININKQTINWSKTIDWKDKIVNKTSQGVQALIKANSVQYINGHCQIISEKSVKIGNKYEVNFENLVLATGSKILELKDFKFDSTQILNSTDLLNLKKIPKSLIILGGGIIGLELGTIFLCLGTKVTIVEMLPELLPTYEKQAVMIVKKSFQELGGVIHTDSKAIKNKKLKNSIKLTIEKKGKTSEISAEYLAVTVGRLSNFDNLDIEKLNINIENDKIVIDQYMRSSKKNIYAIGDIVDGPMLAHKASMEGVLTAEIIAGHKASRGDIKVIPEVIYTKPEIAQVGISEDMAKKSNMEVKIGKFPFTALGMATISMETKGYVKLIAEKKSDIIIGATIVSFKAAELISELVLAIEMGATLNDIALTIHPHPSFGEATMEAAAAGNSSAIHIINRLKTS